MIDYYEDFMIQQIHSSKRKRGESVRKKCGLEDGFYKATVVKEIYQRGSAVCRVDEVECQLLHIFVKSAILSRLALMGVVEKSGLHINDEFMILSTIPFHQQT